MRFTKQVYVFPALNSASVQGKGTTPHLFAIQALFISDTPTLRNIIRADGSRLILFNYQRSKSIKTRSPLIIPD
jgi:hypothetical protein